MSITDRPIFTYAKGYLNDPAEIPSWGRVPEAYPKTLRPQIEAVVGISPHIPPPPTSTNWWKNEIRWMKNHFTPAADTPLLGGLPYVFPKDLDYGPFTMSRFIKPWSRDFANNEESYKSTVAARSGDSYLYDPNNIRDVAVVCHNDVGGQFFVEKAVELFSNKTLKNTPGKFFRGDGTPSSLSQLDLMASIWTCHQAALEEAFLTKWRYLLARPEEVFARGLATADAELDIAGHKLFMVYPEGAPRHPAYPSGHAACAGAGAFVLLQALGDLEGKTDAGKDIIKLAELTFMGRWVAGIHWIADGVGGLIGGWNVAQAMCGMKAPDVKSPWDKLTDGWYV